MEKVEHGRRLTDLEKDNILKRCLICDGTLFNFVSLGFKTGLRLNEMPQYINKCMKTNNNFVEITPLKKTLASHQCVRVIPVYKEFESLKIINTETIKKQIQRMFGTEFSFKDCRSTFANNFAMNNPSPYDLKAVMGWESLDMCTNYITANPYSKVSMYKLGHKQSVWDSVMDKDNEIKRLNLEVLRLKAKLGEEYAN